MLLQAAFRGSSAGQRRSGTIVEEEACGFKTAVESPSCTDLRTAVEVGSEIISGESRRESVKRDILAPEENQLRSSKLHIRSPYISFFYMLLQIRFTVAQVPVLMLLRFTACDECVWRVLVCVRISLWCVHISAYLCFPLYTRGCHSRTCVQAYASAYTPCLFKILAVAQRRQLENSLPHYGYFVCQQFLMQISTMFSNVVKDVSVAEFHSVPRFLLNLERRIMLASCVGLYV